MAQISLTFPDGNARDYDAGVTPAEVAASISSTSRSAPRVISVQVPHALQGSPPEVSRFSQFSALANTRAAVVLPTPRMPENRYA